MSNYVERLAQLDTCLVSDALDSLDMSGVAFGITPFTGNTRIAGKVVTMKLLPKGEEQPKQHLGVKAIEHGSPGDIIVVDNDGRTFVSGWGGTLSIAAKLKGIQGVIIDGAFRDVDECRALGLPIYAKAGACVTAKGRIIEESVNEPISMCKIKVDPGDYVIADSSGVVFISGDRIDDVLKIAEAIAKKEKEFEKKIRQGHSLSEVMGEAYEKMLQRKHES